MGCISSNDVKNPKNYKSNKQRQIQPGLYKSKIGGKSQIQKHNQSSQKNKNQQLPSLAQINPLPKIKKITASEFLTIYDISETLKQSIKLEGPKLITNKINGTTNVLKVYNSDKINEERLKKYHQILKFELYTDQEQNYLLVDQYCSGNSICQLFQVCKINGSDNFEQTSKEAQNKQRIQIFKTLLQIYDIIIQFHSKKLYLGNLNMFSFKRVSPYDDKIQLTDYNFDKELTSSYSMGHAHHNSFQADWEFFGYVLYYFLCYNKSPIWISHKMQYIQVSSLSAYSGMLSNLLKGKQISRKQIQDINTDKLITQNQNILFGYKFCSDVMKLIKIRRRRIKHKAQYYSHQVFQNYPNNCNQTTQNAADDDLSYFALKSNYNIQKSIALSQENLHRFETSKILQTIQEYIEKLNPECEEHFLNYSNNTENYRKLKEIFLIPDKKQKFDQFKQLIPQIK